MANNRIYLKNTISGDTVAIAKHYCYNWHVIRPATLIDELEDFFNKNFEAFRKDHKSFVIDYEGSTGPCCDDCSWGESNGKQ